MRPLLAVLAFPWFVHASVVVLSALGLHPLSGRGPAAALIGVSFFATAALVRSVKARSRDADPATAVVEMDPLPGGVRRLLSALRGGAGLALCGALLAALMLPIVAYDAVSYRLPTIASWLDAGRVAWVTTDDPVRNGYPLGQEAISAVFSAAAGSLRVAALTSFLFVAAGALALSSAARAAGVRPSLASAGGALFLLVPMVLLNAPSGYVDAAFAGAMVACVCSAAVVAAGPHGGRPWSSIAAGMAAAHVLSLKGNGIAFAGIVLVALLASIVRREGGVRDLLVVAGCALPGAFWVIRDVVETGNPLWPIQIVVGKTTIFRGVATMEGVLDVAHNTPPDFRKLSEPSRLLRTWLQTAGPAGDFDDRHAGLGWLWPLAALPAIVAGAVRVARWTRTLWRRRGRAPEVDEDDRAAAILTFVFVVTLACFALQPMRWWARYTLWLWAPGALALSIGAERLAREGRAAFLGWGLALVTVVGLSEAFYAVAHANGLHLALARAPSLAALSDPRKGLNAVHWVEPGFWERDIARAPVFCRGAWKPGDDASLDGIFAQLVPRVPVHVVFDDDAPWPAVLKQWRATPCRELLLLDGSAVLPAARRDPGFTVRPATAFGPVHVVAPK